MPHEGSPETPGKVRPDVAFLCDFFSDKLDLPDGNEVEFWGFEDERGRRSFPAADHPGARGTDRPHHAEGLQDASTRSTTTGSRPTTSTTASATPPSRSPGSYTYQWRAAQAGTYFYHCHVNTTLHFEMGMWGALIVDPPEGPGRAFRGGPALRRRGDLGRRRRRPRQARAPPRRRPGRRERRPEPVEPALLPHQRRLPPRVARVAARRGRRGDRADDPRAHHQRRLLPAALDVRRPRRPR